MCDSNQCNQKLAIQLSKILANAGAAASLQRWSVEDSSRVHQQVADNAEFHADVRSERCFCLFEFFCCSYVENAVHDLKSARELRKEELECVGEEDLVEEMLACYLEGAEEMICSLRVALETFEKVVETLGSLDGNSGSGGVHVQALHGWIADITRMFSAELAHKKLCLARAAELKEGHETLLDWIEEPFINQHLVKSCLEGSE